MQTLFSDSSRIPALPAALFLATVFSLCGCASKNPLMEEPAVAGAGKPAAVNAAEKPAQPTQQAGDLTKVSATTTQRVLGIFSPYRVDVQQGNFVSREIMSQLKEAMNRPEGVSREQARFILGTPLLTDIFHIDRWDYVFRLKKGNGDLIASHVTLFFKGNRLDHVDGSDLPTEKDYLALLVGSVPEPKAPAAVAPSAATPTPQTK